MRNQNSIQKNKVSKRIDYELMRWDAQLEHIRKTVQFTPVNEGEINEIASGQKYDDFGGWDTVGNREII